MAGIDKIYVSAENYLEFVSWLDSVKRFYWEDLNEKLHIREYDLDAIQPNEYLPVLNLGCEGDLWLAINCPFEYITDRLKYMYGAKTKKQLIKKIYHRINENLNLDKKYKLERIKNWLENPVYKEE